MLKFEVNRLYVTTVNTLKKEKWNVCLNLSTLVLLVSKQNHKSYN